MTINVTFYFLTFLRTGPVAATLLLATFLNDAIYTSMFAIVSRDRNYKLLRNYRNKQNDRVCSYVSQPRTTSSLQGD